MKTYKKYLLLDLLGLIGFVDGVMLFFSGGAGVPTWFNPFAGALFLVALPFAGAMVILFGENKK